MKKNKEMQYAVLGLGIFGSTVAKTLNHYDCEVTAIDKDMECVERLADSVTQSIQGDITDITLLRNAGIAECDYAIVAVGSNLEQSILCVLALKELGVKTIIAKAKNKTYARILLQIGANKVVRPEREMGMMVAKGLLNRKIIDMVDLDDKYSIMEINVPKQWVNKTLPELNVRKKFGVNILGIRDNNGNLEVTPSTSYKLLSTDNLLIIAEESRINKLEFLDQ